ncbi:MAG: energy-coupling factor ABC transporter permease, partial [Treponemataceae bacterium]|nr:energy-coupling factor ABC transporter permease [Treponemataceae bacterium]
MHMADALVSPAVAGTMFALSAVAAGYSVKKVHDENDSKKIPLMGVMGAFVFATQMINFTIPGTGSSGHLCGGMMLSALLGPYAGFLTMIGVLLIQCLFFADGGLLALGCNIWNMSFYGCFIGSLLIWKPIMSKGAKQWKIALASILGCVVTLQLGAFSVTLETLASRITDLPFGVFVATMQPIHLAIGFVEGLITAAVLCFVYAARPEFIWGIPENAISADEADGAKAKKGFLSARNTIIVLACLALVIGGGLSLVASSNPDGLEWAMEKVAGTAELEPTEQALNAAEGAGKVQEATSFLPDYTFKNVDEDSGAAVAGTTVSGIAGGAIVAALCICLALLARVIRKAFD